MDTKIHCFNYTQDWVFFGERNYDCYGLVALFGQCDNVAPSRKRKRKDSCEDDATHLIQPKSQQKKNKPNFDESTKNLFNRKAVIINECPAEIWIADQVSSVDKIWISFNPRIHIPSKGKC